MTRLYLRWRLRAKHFLRANPLCADVRSEAAPLSPLCVDHVVPHKGDPVLFLDESNWQGSVRHATPAGSRPSRSVVMTQRLVLMDCPPIPTIRGSSKEEPGGG